MDITMCKNKECTLKESCFRFKCSSTEYQAYFTDIKQDEKGNCEYYWSFKSKEEFDRFTRENDFL